MHSYTTSQTQKPQHDTQALFLAVENHPWQVVVLLRLLPVPIGAKNYGMVRPIKCTVWCYTNMHHTYGRSHPSHTHTCMNVHKFTHTYSMYIYTPTSHTHPFC